MIVLKVTEKHWQLKNIIFSWEHWQIWSNLCIIGSAIQPSDCVIPMTTSKEKYSYLPSYISLSFLFKILDLFAKTSIFPSMMPVNASGVQHILLAPAHEKHFLLSQRMVQQRRNLLLRVSLIKEKEAGPPESAEIFTSCSWYCWPSSHQLASKRAWRHVFNGRSPAGSLQHRLHRAAVGWTNNCFS